MIFKGDSVFLRQRTRSEEEPEAWELPAAHPTAEIAYLEAANKELQDNLFFEMKMPKLIIKEIMKTKIFTNHCYMFVKIFKIDYNGEFQINTESAMNAKLIPINQLIKQVYESPDDFSRVTMQVVQEYKRKAPKA